MIEDNEDDYLIIKEMLAEVYDPTGVSQFNLEWASTYEAGIAAIQQNRHDVILTDYLLGGYTGLEVIREALLMGCQVPLILLTGQRGPQIDLEANKIGASAYLEKNKVDAQVLEQTLCHVVQSYQKPAEAQIPLEFAKYLQALSAAIELRRTNEQLQREVSERKQAEEELRDSEERFRLLVEDVKDYAIFMLHPNGRVASWSVGAERIQGYRAQEIIGQHFSRFHSREDIELGKAGQELPVAVAAGRVEVEGWRVRKNGSRFWANVTITALWNQNGQLRGFSNVTRDATERKRAEEDIHKALAKERELSQLKSTFISRASHEFRTPLTTILTFSELLEQHSHKWSEERKREYVQRIQAAVKHMTGLLDDVLLVNKAEAGKLELNPTPLNLATFCRILVEELQLSNGDQPSINLVIQTSCPQQAYLDEKLLRQILTNLLSNAIKYSPVGGDIQLELSCQDRQVIFQVKDQGIGIPSDDQQHLFESFHRAKNVGHISGTGLGLSIVKKCVETHSGKIKVDSEVGVGTTVSVTLPLNTGRLEQ